MGKFVVTTRSNGQFQFNLLANNNEVILTSEGYITLFNCEKGINSVRVNSKIDKAFDRLVSTNGKPYFNLRAANHEVIGTSELYETIQARENGIDSVMRNAPEADVEISSDFKVPV